MREIVKFLIIAAVVTLVAAGCDPMGGLKTFVKPKMDKKTAKKKETPVPRQAEKDPVRVEKKDEMGISYDPREWLVNNRYDPATLNKLISSPSEQGPAQHTFVCAGGVHNVSVDSTGKHMVYATTQYSMNPQICVQGVSSKAIMKLTEDNMSDMMPKFSPDGDLVAWCSNRYGNWDILVQKTNATPDSRPTQLTRSTDDDIHPTWSPDQKLLAFSRFNSMDGEWQLWVMDYETRTLSYVTEGLFPEFRPVADKDEQGKPAYTLAYQRHRRRDVPWYSLWTIAVRMGNAGAVEAVNAPQEIVADDQWAAITPTWSPNGQFLAFATVRKSPLAQFQARIYKPDDIWIVKIDGTELTQITSHDAPDWNPCWAREPNDPDGPGRIYFTSERTGFANIWSVKPLAAGLLPKATAAAKPADKPADPR